MDAVIKSAATARRTKRRGRHPHKALSAAFVRSAPPGRHADGNGLYLFVQPTGTRSWIQRIVIRGRRRELGLGAAGLVSLAEARELALANRKLARSLRNDNPCDRVVPVLGPQNDIVTHRQALPHQVVAAALETVRDGSAQPAVRLAFEFLVLTAARSGEVRLATWDEIDTAGAVWTVPAARMKAKREHRVPLCGRALEVLDAARTLGGGNRLVFPMRSGSSIAMSTFPKMLQFHEIAAVPHGFRSSFRDWAAEETEHPREVIEAALAHVVQNKVEAAYARSDLFERRRLLMGSVPWLRMRTGGLRLRHGRGSCSVRPRKVENHESWQEPFVFWPIVISAWMVVEPSPRSQTARLARSCAASTATPPAGARAGAPLAHDPAPRSGIKTRPKSSSAGRPARCKGRAGNNGRRRIKHGAGYKSYDGQMREMAAREAKNQFGQLLDAAQRAPVRVTKKGRPVGVMMSMEQYARLRGVAWDALNETMDRMAKRATARGLTDAKLEKLLADDS